ncbi:MAG: energy transducer TonB [Bacteroidota bacterium]|nr:energy transducer TonB [Bacteroidota bacterium]
MSRRFISLICVIILSTTAIFAQQKIDSPANKIFTKVDVEASFPGGDAAWNKYISNAFKEADINFKNADEGTCNVRFIVDKHGNISDVQAMNMKKTRLAKFAVEVIANGPKWKPALQNGKFVNAFRLQPITLKLIDEPKKKRN